MLLQLFYLLLAYLIGSVPVGLILATLYADVDIRETGSGNIGATNVLRSTGRRLGILTLACDLVKGLLPTLGAALVFEHAAWCGTDRRPADEVDPREVRTGRPRKGWQPAITDRATGGR